MKNMLLHRVLGVRFILSILLVGNLTAAAIAQTTYESIGLDCGGYFSGLVAHANGRLYGYGDTFGAFRSDDSGTTWKYLLGDMTENFNSGRGIAVASGDADMVYYLGYSKLIKSLNGGTTWSTVLTGLSSFPDLVRGGSMVLVSPANNNEVWIANAVGTRGGLSRSINGGGDWTKIGGTQFDNVYINSIHIRAAFPNQVWIAGTTGLWVSNNAGSTWGLVWNNDGQPTPYFGAAQASQISSGSAAQGNKLLFGSNYGTWRVTASNWADPSGYTVTKVAMGGHWVGATVLVDGSVVTSRAQENMQILTQNETVATDLPRTLLTSPAPIWTSVANIENQRVLGYGADQILQDPRSPNRWYCTGGMGPAVSTDAGQSWRYTVTGLAGVMTTKAIFSRTNPDVVLIPASDIGITVVRDTGSGGLARRNSNVTFKSLHCYHDVMEFDGGRVLVAAGVHQEQNRSIIIKSSDSGSTWTETDLAGSGLPASHEGITRSVMSATDANDFLVMLGSYDGSADNNPGVWRTVNGGATFTKAAGIPDGLNTGMRYHQENGFLARDGILTDTRYAWVRDGGFYRSTDKGATWTRPSAQPLNGNWIWAMAVDYATASRIWVAGQSNGLIKTDDGGVSWSSPVSFFSGGVVSSVDASNGALVVWGRTSSDSYNKVYYSDDDGVTWDEQSGPGHRYAFTVDVALSPWRRGQIWISGVSVNVIRPQVAVTSKGAVQSTPSHSGPTKYSRLSVGDGGPMPLRGARGQSPAWSIVDLNGRVFTDGLAHEGNQHLRPARVAPGLYWLIVKDKCQQVLQ